MARPGPGLVPLFELYEAAAAAGYRYEAFDRLPTPQQARHVAHRRARAWLDALAAWDAQRNRTP